MSLLAQEILNKHLRKEGDQLENIMAAMKEYESIRNRQIVNHLRAVDKIQIPESKEGMQDWLTTIKVNAAKLLADYQVEDDTLQPLVDALKEAKEYIDWLEENTIHELHVDLNEAASKSVSIKRLFRNILSSYTSTEGELGL